MPVALLLLIIAVGIAIAGHVLLIGCRGDERIINNRLDARFSTQILLIIGRFPGCIINTPYNAILLLLIIGRGTALIINNTSWYG
jgi:hypothetical protein